MLASSHISPSRLSDAVAQRLIARMREGTFPPGSRLPSARRLTKSFGVSQPTIREALRTLETMGLVAVRHGRGVFVQEGSVNGVWTTRWMQWVLAHAPSLLELLEVQEAVEAKAAASAALNTKGADHRRLERLLREAGALVRRAPRDDVDEDILGSYVSLDYAFHSAIAAAARNDFLKTLVHGFGSALQGSREATLAIPGRLRRSLAEHRRIFEAIKRRDAEGARRAMEAHVRRVVEEVRSFEGLRKRGR